MTMKVLTLCGSIRANERHEDAVRFLSLAGDVYELIRRGKETTRQGVILCNSEILSAAAMMGARAVGAEVEYMPLRNLFDHRERNIFEMLNASQGEPELASLALLDTLSLSEDRLSLLLERIAAVDGIVLATPVYFGDRSSVANKFLQITGRKKLLQDKVFGVVSVGAKRNGGQETCNVYSMIEALNQRALVVGNGPPTSQYGGTAVAGNRGHVLEDDWGLLTAEGTGRKVGTVSRLFRVGGQVPPEGNVTIDILLTMDTPARMLKKHLHRIADNVSHALPWVRFRLHELIDANIYRCLGCRVCPSGRDANDGQPLCAIQEDDDALEQIRLCLRSSDGAIIAGLNILDAESIVFRYQVLTERMRYIRRNNFELTDLLIIGLCYHQIGATVNTIHNLKTLTSYIRQNATIGRPIDILEHQGAFLDDGEVKLREFCEAARRMQGGRRCVQPSSSLYEAGGLGGGYADPECDS